MKKIISFSLLAFLSLHSETCKYRINDGSCGTTTGSICYRWNQYDFSTHVTTGPYIMASNSIDQYALGYSETTSTPKLGTWKIIRKSDGVVTSSSVMAYSCNAYFVNKYGAIPGSYVNPDTGEATNQEMMGRTIYLTPSSAVGAGITIGGGLILSAGLGLSTLGIMSATAAGLVTAGGIITVAGLATMGVAIWQANQPDPTFTPTYTSPVSTLQYGENRIKVNLKTDDSQQVVTINSSNQVKQVVNVPKPAVDQINNATIDRNTGQVTSSIDKLKDITYTNYDYDTNTATTTKNDGTVLGSTSFSTSINSDGTQNIVSSNPAVAPSYDGSTGTFDSNPLPQSGSGGTYDSSVHVSDAAGTSSNGSSDTPATFGDIGGVESPDETKLTDLVGQYTDFVSNIASSGDTLITNYDYAKTIIDGGFDLSHANQALADRSSSGCNFSFSVLGQEIPIPLTFFAYLRPLFYSIIVIFMNFWIIRAWLSILRPSESK